MYVIFLTYHGFDPVFLVPVVRINEVQKRSWEGFYLKKQQRKLFFLLLKQKTIPYKKNVNSFNAKTFLDIELQSKQ